MFKFLAKNGIQRMSLTCLLYMHIANGILVRSLVAHFDFGC